MLPAGMAPLESLWPPEPLVRSAPQFGRWVWVEDIFMRGVILSAPAMRAFSVLPAGTASNGPQSWDREPGGRIWPRARSGSLAATTFILAGTLCVSLAADMSAASLIGMARAGIRWRAA